MGQAKPRQHVTQVPSYPGTDTCAFVGGVLAGQRRRISIARRLFRFVSLPRPSALSVWVVLVETA